MNNTSSDHNRSNSINERTTTIRAPTYPGGATSIEWSPTHGFLHPRRKLRKRFLADTSATVSMYQPLKDDHSLPSDDRAALVAANGSPITCYGTRTLKISIMGQDYSWPFLIADVKVPLLGTDFLSQNGLLVDVHHKRLFSQGTYLYYHLSCSPSLPKVCLVQVFSNVFKPELRQMEGVPAKYRIYHHIIMIGPPTHGKFRHIPPKKLQESKRAFLEMERMGICKKASSPWVSPLHIVKKPDGS
ncbi:uncharacterized protein [Palaemon carinicauda]|uniref:uncharacterized protein n=1 Tax=Palaemon carinicauda TaxID=392227 RepID=UPI0035B5A5EB